MSHRNPRDGGSQEAPTLDNLPPPPSYEEAITTPPHHVPTAPYTTPQHHGPITSYTTPQHHGPTTSYTTPQPHSPTAPYIQPSAAPYFYPAGATPNTSPSPSKPSAPPTLYPTTITYPATPGRPTSTPYPTTPQYPIPAPYPTTPSYHNQTYNDNMILPAPQNTSRAEVLLGRQRPNIQSEAGPVRKFVVALGAVGIMCIVLYFIFKSVFYII